MKLFEGGNVTVTSKKGTETKDLINPYYDGYRMTESRDAFKITESKPSGFRNYLKNKGFI